VQKTEAVSYAKSSQHRKLADPYQRVAIFIANRSPRPYNFPKSIRRDLHKHMKISKELQLLCQTVDKFVTLVDLKGGGVLICENLW